jgi:5-oxoprolinase (ATP-hydrolysing)
MAPGKMERQPNEVPCSGTRNLRDNMSDLKAQVHTHTYTHHHTHHRTRTLITARAHADCACVFCQVAANNKGIHLVGELIEEYGLEVVQAYMFHGTFTIIILFVFLSFIILYRYLFVSICNNF